MALTRTKNREKKYNDQQCWELAMSWGAAFSVSRLHKWHLENKGFGSRMGPVWAMWRWAMENPELCYPQYKQWYFQNAINTTEWVMGGGVVEKNIEPDVTFEEFMEDVKRHIKDNVLGRKSYKLFCKKHGLKE